MDLLVEEFDVFESTVVSITAASFLEELTDCHGQEKFVKDRGRKNKLGWDYFFHRGQLSVFQKWLGILNEAGNDNVKGLNAALHES